MRSRFPEIIENTENVKQRVECLECSLKSIPMEGGACFAKIFAACARAKRLKLIAKAKNRATVRRK